jgi:hypothetical protein
VSPSERLQALCLEAEADNYPIRGEGDDRRIIIAAKLNGSEPTEIGISGGELVWFEDGQRTPIAEWADLDDLEQAYQRSLGDDEDPWGEEWQEEE